MRISILLIFTCFIITNQGLAQDKKMKQRIKMRPSAPTSISPIRPPSTANLPQENPLAKFESSILKFEQEDRVQGITKGAVLFIGSSSIVFWKDLNEDMDGMPVLNRGFGGSTIPEVNYYTERIVFPYEPSMIVFYCGENDINAGASPERVATDFKNWHQRVDLKFPDIPIVFISMKPSISRWALKEQFEQGNTLIKEYIEQQEQLSYINVDPVMLNEAGEPDPDIFISDGLHMNRTGYERWTALMRTHIEEVYKQGLKADK